MLKPFPTKMSRIYCKASTRLRADCARLSLRQHYLGYTQLSKCTQADTYTALMYKNIPCENKCNLQPRPSVCCIEARAAWPLHAQKPETS